MKNAAPWGGVGAWWRGSGQLLGGVVQVWLSASQTWPAPHCDADCDFSQLHMAAAMPGAKASAAAARMIFNFMVGSLRLQSLST